jgi:serine/threonine protein kinase
VSCEHYVIVFYVYALYVILLYILNYFNYFITSGYRPPELLFGSTYYSWAVDVWSAGCIIMEILLRAPIFPGDTEIAQLASIFNLLGTPAEAIWPGVSQLPGYLQFEPRDSMFPMISLSPPKLLPPHTEDPAMILGNKERHMKLVELNYGPASQFGSLLIKYVYIVFHL